MKILIAGSKGQVGRELVAIAKKTGVVFKAIDIDELDIGSFMAVDRIVKEFRPTHIINAAAYNNVDGAEDDFQPAFMTNAFGPANLALAALQSNAVIVHYSTDYVFDGLNKTPYTEDDKPNPLSTYGRSKLLGEQAVLSISPMSYVLRTAWVYSPGGNNFISRLLKLAESGKELKFINDCVCSPTYAKDLASVTFELIGRKAPFGLYHAVGQDSCSPFEWASTVLKKTNPSTLITPVSRDFFKTKAARPQMSKLANVKLEKLGINIAGWRDRLNDYFR